jgi:tetratricopeptide (TPR) repeat protein
LLTNGRFLIEGYLLAGEYDRARDAADELLGLAERCRAQGYVGRACRLLGEAALHTNPEEAAPHFTRAISTFEQVNAENELALAKSGMGRYQKHQGDVDQAREYLTRALDIFERLGTLIEPDKVRKDLAELPH